MTPSSTRIDAASPIGGSSRTSTELTAGLDGGWLCFENAREKRRLAPIPNWTRCSSEELDRYLQSAKRAHRPATAPRLAAPTHH